MNETKLLLDSMEKLALKKTIDGKIRRIHILEKHAAKTLGRESEGIKAQIADAKAKLAVAKQKAAKLNGGA